MEITAKHDGNLIFTLKGRLDTITSPDLENKFKEEEIEEDKVILDFTELEYISSAGLRAILSIKRNLDAKKKTLEIHNINDVIKEVFSVTGFNNILVIK